MNPSRANPIPISMTATITANMPASATARRVSPTTTRGTRAAKIIGETAESGPKTRTLDGPKAA